MLMLIITVIAIADIIYVRWSYFKSLRMTKQEVKDEHKQMEGDPMVRGRLRSIRLEKARRRMMAKVPNASVIVTNPTHYAIALEYDGSKMAAPVVTAKGVDNVAMRIRSVAEEHDIPIVSNPPLARTLYDTVELDDPIEPEQYRAVAEVISYVFKLKNKVKT
jgi:flagellar biosynthetic protein FlhB